MTRSRALWSSWILLFGVAGCPSPEPPEPPVLTPAEPEERAGVPDEGSEGSGEAPVPAAVEEPPEPVAPPPNAGPDGQLPVACGTPPDGMACVPGGWFTRGVDEDPHDCDQADQPQDGTSSMTPADRVWLETFYIDVTEVTNAAYQRCVAADGCVQAGPLYRDFDGDRQPITGMTWFEARDYCAWRGGGLPTDAQWEAAARGPDGEQSPWGDAPATCDLAILMDDRGRSCGVTKRGSHPEAGKVADVCSLGPQRYGLCDMVGNAEEWVADWWTPDWATCGDDCAGVNPTGPCDGADDCPDHRYKSIRGGSWYWPAEHATGWHRRRYEPENDPPHHFGFRCAAPVDAGARWPGTESPEPSGE